MNGKYEDLFSFDKAMKWISGSLGIRDQFV
jgi:hypothetical protein